MKSTNEWYGIVNDYATDNNKNLLVALNEVFQSDDEMTEEQFDELEAVFRKDMQATLYRVFFSTSGAEYGRCFSNRAEAEHFYNGLLKSKCYSNVKFQIG